MKYKGVTRVNEDKKIILKDELVNLPTELTKRDYIRKKYLELYKETTKGLIGRFTLSNNNTNELKSISFNKKDIENIQNEELKESILLSELYLSALFEDDIIDIFNDLGPKYTTLILKEIQNLNLNEIFEKNKLTKSEMFTILLNDENVDEYVKQLLIFQLDKFCS